MRLWIYNSLSSAKKVEVLAEAQNWRCAYCGIRCDGDNAKPTRDHIVPKSILAREFFTMNHWENEVMACALCNNSRGAMWARKYFRMVQWKGRERASRWARRRHSERAKSSATPNAG